MAQAAPRPALRDRRGLPRPGGPEHAHAHRRRRAAGRAAADTRRVPRARALAAAPRPALPAEDRVKAPLETGLPLWIDDPTFNLGYHVRHTALPAPGDQDDAADARRAAVLPAAGPLQAAVGAVPRRGPRRRRLRAASPRPTTRSSTASRAPTSPRCCSTSSPRAPTLPPRRAVGPAAASRRAPSSSPAASRARRGPRPGSPPRSSRDARPARRRSAARASSPPASARSPAPR